MHIFYVEIFENQRVFLSEEESKHAIKVLRLKVGDEIQVIDGVGGFYTAKLLSENQKRCEIEFTGKRKNFGKLPYNLTIGIAPTKNIDRLEWFLEKATEIGIACFIPILTEHSERKVIKNERLERVILAAAKQSIKAFLPKLFDLHKFEALVSENFEGEKFIAHCNSENLPLLKNKLTKNSNVLILIGPEGDFSPKEVEMALAAGFKEISLGGFRLRTETAGVVACHTVSLVNSD